MVNAFYGGPRCQGIMTTNNSTPHLPADYNEQVRRTIPYYDSIHAETIELVRSLDRPPQLWLDTGCGTGAMVKLALSQMPGTEFVLADPSDSMLEVARESLRGEGRVHILGPLRTQDLRGRVDREPEVITAIQCHHYLSRAEREEAVRTCYDLLSPGGAFITFENVRPLTAAGTAIGKRGWHRFLVSNGRTPQEAEDHLDRFDKEYFPITVEDHLDLLRRVGFGTVELFRYSRMQVGLYGMK